MRRKGRHTLFFVIWQGRNRYKRMRSVFVKEKVKQKSVKKVSTLSAYKL